MTKKLLTVDEFRDSAKDGEAPEGAVYRFAVTEPQVSTEGRKVRFVFSDGTVDRSGDSIDPKGWKIESFNKNPVALWCHDSSSPPIGRALNVGSASGKLVGDIDFMPPDISPFADSIYRMVQGGYIKAVSVGFMPLDWKFSKEKDRPFGIDFTKQELLEISVCPVPCNPNALQEAKSAGIDTGPIRDWASKVLDEGGHILIPRNILEETFRQAKTPRVIRQKYLDKSGSSAKSEADWKAGAADDLPVANSDMWDGAAAAKRMLDAAGFDSDTPDAAKAARGFLIHDAANPGLRDSYKMPFADLFGGELRAVRLGILSAKDAATKERAKKSDAPAALDDALALINNYEQKSGDDAVIDAVIPAADEAVTITALTEKSGRRISNANTARLKEAMDHHESATQCIKDVLDSNTPDDNPDDEEPDDQGPPVTVVTLDARAQRLKEAADFKASLKI